MNDEIDEVVQSTSFAIPVQLFGHSVKFALRRLVRRRSFGSFWMSKWARWSDCRLQGGDDVLQGGFNGLSGASCSRRPSSNIPKIWPRLSRSVGVSKLRCGERLSDKNLSLRRARVGVEHQRPGNSTRRPTRRSAVVARRIWTIFPRRHVSRRNIHKLSVSWDRKDECHRHGRRTSCRRTLLSRMPTSGQDRRLSARTMGFQNSAIRKHMSF